MALIGRVGSILWRGDTGSSAWANESKSTCGTIPSKTELLAFGAAVESRSNCNLNYLYNTASFDQSVGAPGVGANIDKKAVIFFRDPSDLTVKKFQYPDPIATDIEESPWGKKIKDSAVTAIVALLSTMSGISYEPLYGVYYQRK